MYLLQKYVFENNISSKAYLWKDNDIKNNNFL